MWDKIRQWAAFTIVPSPPAVDRAGGRVTFSPRVLLSNTTPQCCSAVSQQQQWQSLDAGHSSAGLLGAEAGSQLQWCLTVMVCGLSGVVPRQVSQTQQHQEALPQGDSGDLMPCLTDALPAAQLLFKQSWDWGLFLFIPLHKIFKFGKKIQKQPTPTSGKPPLPKGVSREGYFPFAPAGAGLLSLCPVVQCFPFWGLMFWGQTWMQEPVQIRGLLSLAHGPLASPLQSEYKFTDCIPCLPGACCATQDWFLSHPAVSPKSCREMCQCEPY